MCNDSIPTTSTSVKNIMDAMFRVKRAMEPARKDASNERFASKYATLNSVMAACDGPLASEQILVLQFPTVSPSEGCVRVITEFRHLPSGEFITCPLDMPMAKNDAQGMGSAITYARRYALTALLGIPTQDDDGNAASQKPARRTAARDDTEIMWGLLRKKHGSNSEAMLAEVREILGRPIRQSADLGPADVRRIIDALAA